MYVMTTVATSGKTSQETQKLLGVTTKATSGGKVLLGNTEASRRDHHGHIGGGGESS